jgi:hypothetical protein
MGAREVTAIRRLYTLGVLWLLSVVAQDAAEAIYRHGHDDGATALREWTRKELLDVQASTITARAISYRQGFADALRLYDDEPIAELVDERVH